MIHIMICLSIFISHYYAAFAAAFAATLRLLLLSRFHAFSLRRRCLRHADAADDVTPDAAIFRR